MIQVPARDVCAWRSDDVSACWLVAVLNSWRVRAWQWFCQLLAKREMLLVAALVLDAKSLDTCVVDSACGRLLAWCVVSVE